MLAIALLIAATPIEPISLVNLGTRRARSFDGQRVLVSLMIGKPPIRGRVLPSSAQMTRRTEPENGCSERNAVG
jgi:hypothetical protein